MSGWPLTISTLQRIVILPSRMIRESGECIVNLPTAYMLDTVSMTGNCDGDSVDKFSELGLTKTISSGVAAVGIEECNASFECKLYDGAQAVDCNRRRDPDDQQRSQPPFPVSGLKRTSDVRRRAFAKTLTHAGEQRDGPRESMSAIGGRQRSAQKRDPATDLVR